MSDNSLTPQDDDAERGLLAAAMIDCCLLEDVPYIRPDHFRVMRYGRIWDAMWKLYERHHAFDMVALSKEVNGSVTELLELTQMDALSVPQPIFVYADRVRAAATRRAMIEASQTVARMGYADKTDINECLDGAMSAVETVLNGYVSVTDETRDARDVVGDVLADAWSWHNNPADVRGVSCGLEPVDEMLGGFETGWLYSIAGRPGQGKSALLARLAWGFARQKQSVLIFSLEMTAKAFFKRMGCQIAHVDAGKLFRGRLSQEEIQRYNDAMEDVATYPIKINARSGMTIREMQTVARRHERQHGGLAVVMVDTLNRVNTSGDKAYERMTQASHAMADWAHSSNYAIIQAVQMSRANENMADKRPTLSALRDSGAIEEDNDVILGLYRPHYYDRDNDAIKNNAELRVLKFRDGDSDAQADLYWRPECLSFDRGEWRNPLDQPILGMNTH